MIAGFFVFRIEVKYVTFLTILVSSGHYQLDMHHDNINLVISS